METSGNLAVQIVDSACQNFGQLVAQQAALSPIAKKNNKQFEAWLRISKFAFILLALSIVWLISSAIWADKHRFMLSMNITFGIMALNSITVLVSVYFYGQKRLYQQTSKKITAGRLNYVKEVINRALMEHMCANEDDNTEDFYFKRMQKITSGFFADDFNSSLTAEETSEIRNWLRSSYSACLRAD